MIKAAVVFAMALYFSLIALNNFMDFESNRAFVEQVLTLDTIQNNAVAWRAIGNETIQLACYLLFIVCESAIAIILWIGAISLLRGKSNRTAMVGLTIGFLLFMVGFVVIAGEWFYLWQSELKVAQTKAIILSILHVVCLIYVSKVDEKTTLVV